MFFWSRCYVQQLEGKKLSIQHLSTVFDKKSLFEKKATSNIFSKRLEKLFFDLSISELFNDSDQLTEEGRKFNFLRKVRPFGWIFLELLKCSNSYLTAITFKYSREKQAFVSIGIAPYKSNCLWSQLTLFKFADHLLDCFGKKLQYSAAEILWARMQDF